MQIQHIIHTHVFFDDIPLIDGEFDSFEIKNDLEMQLRHSEIANVYHDALSEEG